MGKFKFKAMSKAGERSEGVYEATSKDEVLAMITSNDCYPLLVEELNEGTKIEFGKNSRIKTKDLSIFCRQFSTMIEAGVSISYAVNILATQLPNKRLRDILSKIDESIKKGESLSSSMKEHQNAFPPLLISMIEVGEVSGTLDTILKRMAVYYENENKLNGKVRNAMIYPAILAFVTVGVVILILTVVMPTFMDIFTQSGVQLPWTTKLTLGLSYGIRDYWFIIFPAIIAIIVGVRYYCTKNEKGIMNYSIFKLKYSIFKRINQQMVVSKFTRSLSTVLAAGVNLIQSLDVVAGVVNNKFTESEIRKIKERVLKGENLADPIKEVGVFPPMLSSMVKIGEESGALDDILFKTADFYDDELERAVQAFTAMLEPIMIIVMGIIIGFIIISMVTPMFNMFSSIK